MLDCCNTLWIGDGLGPIERACLRSALRAGHRVRLFSYRPLAGVPDGVECCDAAEILPESRVIRHHTGSVALFSDWFRYELQRRECGLWLDADVYVLRPIDIATPFVFGFEDDTLISGAVLKIPSHSPLLASLLEIFDERTIPFWLSSGEQAAAQARLATLGRTGLSEAPWGTAGPDALTAYVKRFGLEHLALDRAVFYPAHYSNADWILGPWGAVEEFMPPETKAIHLWNEMIKPWKGAPAPAGSFLERLRREGG